MYFITCVCACVWVRACACLIWCVRVCMLVCGNDSMCAYLVANDSMCAYLVALQHTYPLGLSCAHALVHLCVYALIHLRPHLPAAYMIIKSISLPHTDSFSRGGKFAHSSWAQGAATATDIMAKGRSLGQVPGVKACALAKRTRTFNQPIATH